MTDKKVWLNGEIIDWDDANVHLSCHSLHYGDSIFEGIRFYETGIFRLKEHIERMFSSCEKIGLNIPYNQSQTLSGCKNLINSSGLKSGYIRILVYPQAGIGLRKDDVDASIVIFAMPWNYKRKDLRLCTSKIMRLHKDSTLVESKISGNYINSLLARREAAKKGYDDAVLLDYKGRITESSGGNLFFVKNEEVLTPKTGRFFSGITRESVIQILKDNDIIVKEIDILPDDLADMDDCFMTSTASEISHVKQIDNNEFSENNITRLVMYEFHKIVTGKNKKYNWLTEFAGSS